MSYRIVTALLVPACLFVACEPASQQELEEAVVVLPGKTDDFFAPKAQEYIVEGVTEVTLESSYAYSSEEARLTRVKELIPLKQVVIGWFLNSYLIDKSRDADNASYGGFNSLTKNGAYEDLEITHVDGLTYSFRFQQELGGHMDLLSRLPTTQDEEGRHQFDLTIGRISNSDMARLETDREWYRSSPWSTFNPDTVDPSRLDKVTLTIWPQPRSLDAWMDYNRLYEDGELTVGAHFGWDYHGDYHIKHARSTYGWLTQRGFQSPVGRFDDYRHDSGPLTRTIYSEGRPVEVKVWLRWGQPGTATDPDTDAGGRLLEELMRHDFATADAILFSGHSGPFYGFALANWKKTSEGDLDDSEIPGMEMPEKYQVVLAEGCDTYALGQAFRMNPAKEDRTNIDVITTTSFSSASAPTTVYAFLEALVGTDQGAQHQAKRYSEVLTRMDSGTTWFSTLYGVHGIDANPKLHPYANPENLCAPCNSDSECGGQGNLCAKLPEDSGKACAAECTADEGCPSGYVCLDIARGSWLTTKACVPSTYTCEEPLDPDSDPRGKIIINEFGADPTMGLAGDWNGDGVRNALEDEFIEIVNTTYRPMRLGGWTISDAIGVRFTFPEGAAIPARGAVLVFGGGEPPIGGFRGVQTFTADRTLSLNNGGDTVTLATSRGGMVDEVVYGRAAGFGMSLVRMTDGDPDSDFMFHPGPNTASPGTKSDGSDFGI